MAAAPAPLGPGVGSALERLAEAQARTEEALAALTDRVGRMDGELMELRYERRALAYLSRLALGLRVVDTGQLAELLNGAVERGELAEEDRHEVLLSDLVLSGRRREDGAAVYLVVEVSAGVGPGDVHRAADRAQRLAGLGRPVLPVVAGRHVTPEARELARQHGVWQVADGRVLEGTS